jgi:hypothetical protein
MAQVITIAGERLFALKAQNNEQLDVDTFIFANVPGQDPNATIDRDEGLPPVGQIVHQQIVQQVGRVNDNVVIYSTVMDSLTGPFDFNWVGLYSSVNQTLIAVSHIPNVSKTVTVPGAAGNTLNRNFGIEYSGIADLTEITVKPETWQLDFTARLSGMDELTRQLAADMNGKDWFIGDGFKVVPRSTANTFKVTPGAGYVSGLRIELKQDHILTLQSYPQFVYVDAWFDGDASSQWKPKTAFTVTNGEMDDYIDVNGKQHYVFKLARITAADVAEDFRSENGLPEKIDKHFNNEDGVHNNIYQRVGIVSEIISKRLREGDKLLISDRSHEKFEVFSGEANGGYNEIQCIAPNEGLYLKRVGYQIADLHSQSDFSSLFQKLNIVITGDSLSWNGYGYDATWGIDGSGYATDNVFGLSSWSYLVRDFIFSSNPAYKGIFNINWYSTGVVARGLLNSDLKYFGMNGRVITFNFENAESKVILETNSGLSRGIVVHTTSENYACKFDIDGIEHNNVSPTNGINYLGGGYKIIPCGVEPLIENVRKFTSDLPGGELSIYGISSDNAGGSNAAFPMITGKGGYTAAKILDEYNTLVKPYMPDVVFYMIGANDIDKNVNVSEFKSSIENFIDLVRNDSPNAKVILMTTTPVATWEDGRERKYIKAMEEVRDDKYCYLINVFDELKNIDPYYWRFDNTHLNRLGNDIVFKLVKDKIFPAMNVDNKKFIPSREVYAGLNGIAGKRNQLTNCIEVECTQVTPTITYKQNGNFSKLCKLEYLSEGGFELMRIIFPDGYSFSSSESMHINSSDIFDELKVKSVEGNIVDIFRVAAGSGKVIKGSNNKIRICAGRLFNQV